VILVDTSVWIDHFFKADERLVEHLMAGDVVSHPMVVGEIAVGNMAGRRRILAMLNQLTQIMVADHDEVLGFIETQRLFGMGIGYVDAHLLAAARLMPDVRLWTFDKKLAASAVRLGVAAKV